MLQKISLRPNSDEVGKFPKQETRLCLSSDSPTKSWKSRHTEFKLRKPNFSMNIHSDLKSAKKWEKTEALEATKDLSQAVSQVDAAVPRGAIHNFDEDFAERILAVQPPILDTSCTVKMKLPQPRMSASRLSRFTALCASQVYSATSNDQCQEPNDRLKSLSVETTETTCEDQSYIAYLPCVPKNSTKDASARGTHPYVDRKFPEAVEETRKKISLRKRSCSIAKESCFRDSKHTDVSETSPLGNEHAQFELSPPSGYNAVPLQTNKNCEPERNLVEESAINVDKKPRRAKRKKSDSATAVTRKRLKKGSCDIHILSNTVARNGSPPVTAHLKEKGTKNEMIERQVKPTKPEKKASLVSQNFVKLDLRRKKYSRGQHSVIKGGRYKRKMWRLKSQFSIKGNPASHLHTSSATCFRCGKEGHWARNCKNAWVKRSKSKTDLDYEAELPLEETGAFSTGENGVELESAEAAIKAIESTPYIEPCWPRVPYYTRKSAPSLTPLFNPINGHPPQEAHDAVRDVLLQFGYREFREGQEQTTARIVSGLSTLLVVSTGSGKSLCYQIPAYLYYKLRHCMTLVISPLVALMEDQVTGLPFGLKGACLHTNMTKSQRERVIANVTKGDIAVLLVSPETIASGGYNSGFLSMIPRFPKIAFACIDEAHCVSEWSHNFRPSYLRVCKILREKFGICTMLGLTATATEATSQSIAVHLGISAASYNEGIIRGYALPENLVITVSRDPDRDQAIVSLLSSAKYEDCNSIIIYCTRREQTERLANVLNSHLRDGATHTESRGNPTSFRRVARSLADMRQSIAEPYHAGLSPTARRRVQKLFMASELRVVVATVAFGMGLDKSDVRAIIHYNMPKSFENFVQEIGRAGRDGEKAFCHVFLDDQGADISELRRHAFASSMDEFTVKEFVKTIFPSCCCLQQKSQAVGQGESLSDKCRFQDTKITNGFAIDSENSCPLIDRTKTDAITEADNGLLENAKGQVEGKDENFQAFNLPEQICFGHHLSLPVTELMEKLDLTEESISTLIAYLELHPRSLVEFCGTVRAKCQLKFYGGPQQFASVLARFLPLQVSLTLLRKKGEKLHSFNGISFNWVEVADYMCWDTDPLLRELRGLQWNTEFAATKGRQQIGKSGILAEFDDLAFHVVSFGLQSESDRDSITDYLLQIVKTQEKQRLLQLDGIYGSLRDVSHRFHYQCDYDENRTNVEIRDKVERYFKCNAESIQSFLESLITVKLCESEIPDSKLGTISRDVRNLVSSNPDLSFTGRAIARIFHGIESPRFPATTWGRNRTIWRRYLDLEFNALRKFITEELIKYRN